MGETYRGGLTVGVEFTALEECGANRNASLLQVSSISISRSIFIGLICGWRVSDADGVLCGRPDVLALLDSVLGTEM